MMMILMDGAIENIKLFSYNIIFKFNLDFDLEKKIESYKNEYEYRFYMIL